MSKTRIEWADEVWNPVTGCTKVSEGCRNCYAERMAGRFWGGRKFTEVWTHPERLDDPLRWKKPRRVFVNSMSDLFHEGVSLWFVAEVFARMAACPEHTFMVLTKRPIVMHGLLNNKDWAYEVQRLYSAIVENGPDLKWPLPNVWLGVSAETQKEADARIPILLQTPAAVRFVSVEPMLGAVILREDWMPHYDPKQHYAIDPPNYRDKLDWVICGGESGPGARSMHPDWARGLRDQCQAAQVPFFFKQWGEWVPGYPQYGDTDPVVRFEDLSEVDNVVARDERCLENTGSEAVIMADGNPVTFWQPRPNRNPWWMLRVGKKAAGRELDGRTWEERPGE